MSSDNSSPSITPGEETDLRPRPAEQFAEIALSGPGFEPCTDMGSSRLPDPPLEEIPAPAPAPTTLLGLGDSSESQAFKKWAVGGPVLPRSSTVTPPAAGVSRFKVSRPTGAFDSAVTSLRYMPKAYNWGEVLGTVGVLYGLCVGVPAIAGLWSASRIFDWGLFNWLPW